MALFKRKTAEIDLTDFDNAVRALLRRHVPPGTDVDEHDDDSLRHGDNVTHLATLRRQWSEREPDARLDWLDGVVAALANGAPQAPRLNTDQLRPSIRSRTTVELTSLQMSQTSNSPSAATHVPLQPIAADLAWCVVNEETATARTVSSDQLDEWGLAFDELLGIATSNLTTRPISGWNAFEDRVFSPADNDDYTGARVFLPGALDPLPLTGEYVIFHPTRSSVFVVSSHDADAVRIAAELTLKQNEAANPVSLIPVVGTPHNWRALELDHTHPAFHTCKTLSVTSRARGYGYQAHLLQAQVGSELFVAPFEPKQTPAGEVFSQVTWTGDVEECLLPHTDVIGFGMRPNADPMLVPTGVVGQIIGHLMEPTSHFPERTRVPHFPSEQELAELAKFAIDLNG